MLLRNFDLSTKYFDYKSKTEEEYLLDPQINGWYKFINGEFSALLVKDKNLYFLYKDEEILITESHKALVEKKKSNDIRFSLLKCNSVLIQFTYYTSDIKLNVQPFEYIDENDFEWGNFIANIINYEDQKRNFIMNLMESL